MDFQPEGVAERLEVERLALLYWRQRRFLQAETAEIAQVAEVRPLESLCAQLSEKIEEERAGELLEKMVELSLNPFLIMAAMKVCALGRSRLEELDVESDQEFIRAYRIYAEIASEVSETVATEEEVKKLALQMMEEKLQYLTVWREAARKRYHRLKELGAIAAQVPAENVSERLVRYETHLSREIDRTLNRLERLQEMRLNRATPTWGESLNAA